MPEGNARRVAVFQADWPVQSQTVNAVAALAQAGYEVELFLFKAHTYVDLGELQQWPGVEVYDLTAADLSHPSTTPAETHGLRRRVRTRLRALAPRLASWYSRARSGLASVRYASRRILDAHVMLDENIVKQALQIMQGKEYASLIGVEKRGLVWAGALAEQLGVPYMYFSLELYTEDFGRFADMRLWQSVDFKRLRATERMYHKKAAATIIQDPDRAQVLFRANRLALEGARVFYVPVSLRGGVVRSRSRFLHESLGILDGTRVILYFGQINEDRYAVELAKAAQSFPREWRLVMHGWGDSEVIHKIKALDSHNRLVISLEMVPSDLIPELIASADVGLALYSPRIENDRLTAFSSEKMALYLQCGVPFVAFDYPGYQRLASEDRCGAVIHELTELPAAINQIFAAHGQFRVNAYKAFGKYYDFEKSFAKVIEGLEQFR